MYHDQHFQRNIILTKMKAKVTIFPQFFQLFLKVVGILCRTVFLWSSYIILRYQNAKVMKMKQLRNEDVQKILLCLYYIRPSNTQITKSSAAISARIFRLECHSIFPRIFLPSRTRKNYAFFWRIKDFIKNHLFWQDWSLEDAFSYRNLGQDIKYKAAESHASKKIWNIKWRNGSSLSRYQSFRLKCVFSNLNS